MAVDTAEELETEAIAEEDAVAGVEAGEVSAIAEDATNKLQKNDIYENL